MTLSSRHRIRNSSPGGLRPSRSLCIFVDASKQTRHVEPTPAQCWPTVNDSSPTLKQHWTNTSRSPAFDRIVPIEDVQCESRSSKPHQQRKADIFDGTWSCLSDIFFQNYHNRGKRRQAEQRVAIAMGVSSQHICFTSCVCLAPDVNYTRYTPSIKSYILMTWFYSNQHFTLKLKTEFYM